MKINTFLVGDYLINLDNLNYFQIDSNSSGFAIFAYMHAEEDGRIVLSFRTLKEARKELQNIQNQLNPPNMKKVGKDLTNIIEGKK